MTKYLRPKYIRRSSWGNYSNRHVLGRVFFYQKPIHWGPLRCGIQQGPQSDISITTWNEHDHRAIHTRRGGALAIPFGILCCRKWLFKATRPSPSVLLSIQWAWSSSDMTKWCWKYHGRNAGHPGRHIFRSLSRLRRGIRPLTREIWEQPGTVVLNLSCIYRRSNTNHHTISDARAITMGDIGTEPIAITGMGVTASSHIH